MSNQQALDEMLSLWGIWEADDTARLPHGLAPWKHVFRLLRTIRRWDARDRLGVTGVLVDWRERLAEGQSVVHTEVELWYRSSPDARQEAGRRVSQLIEREGGRVLARGEIGEIAYHAFLAELPRDAVERILETQDAAVVRADEVMFFRPVGRSCRAPSRRAGGGGGSRGPRPPATLPDEGEEIIVAVFDGLPLENHELLRGRLAVDDPDDWGSSYPVDARVHGTAMCSLVIHGDLADVADGCSTRRVYVRPIMRPEALFGGELREAVPENGSVCRPNPSRCPKTSTARMGK